MGTQFGKLLLQFQSYGFATVNRVLIPAVQRGVTYGDLRTLEAATVMLGAASLVTAIKGYINGRDPSKYTVGQWSKEVIDRSGVTAYMSPYIDASLKLAKQAGAPGIGDGFSSRYSRNTNWVESFLGPWWSTVKTGMQVTNEAAAFPAGHGDAKKLREKALLLVPFNQWFRLGRTMIDGPQE